MAIVCLVLAACAGPGLSRPTPAAEVVPSLAVSAPLPTFPAAPSPIPEALPAQDPTLAPALSAAPDADLGPTFTPPFRLCSPLGEHPLAELPEIISDPYHPPPPGHEERHQGVDFSYYRRGARLSIQGVSVQTVLSGRVAAALSAFPYGNMVIVETPAADLPAGLAASLGVGQDESLYLLYAHMELPPQVRLGESLPACQPIGTVGKSGNAGVAHLHLEIRIGPAAAAFPEMRYYDLHATQAENDAYLRWRTSGVFRHFDPMRLLSQPPGR